AALRARDRMGADDRIHDVDFRELVRDPVGVVRDVTRRFDLAWAEDPEVVVQRVLDERRKDKRGAHRYDGAFYGLDRSTFYERFGAYVDRCDLAPRHPEAPAALAAGG